MTRPLQRLRTRVRFRPLYVTGLLNIKSLRLILVDTSRWQDDSIMILRRALHTACRNYMSVRKEGGNVWSTIPYGIRSDGLHWSRYEILTSRALYPRVQGKWVIYDIQFLPGLEVMAHTDLDIRY